MCGGSVQRRYVFKAKLACWLMTRVGHTLLILVTKSLLSYIKDADPNVAATSLADGRRPCRPDSVQDWQTRAFL